MKFVSPSRILLALGIVVALFFALSYSPKEDLDPKAIATAQEIILSSIDETLAANENASWPPFRKAIQSANPEISAAKLAELKVGVIQIVKTFAKDSTTSLAESYARHLTQSELAVLHTFITSPLGRKSVRVSNQITPEHKKQLMAGNTKIADLYYTPAEKIELAKFESSDSAKKYMMALPKILADASVRRSEPASPSMMDSLRDLLAEHGLKM